MAKIAPKKIASKLDDPSGEVDPSADDGADEPDDDAEVNNRINAIVTNRVKREMKQVNAQLAQLTEMLGKMSKPQPGAHDTEGDQSDDDDSSKKPTTVVEDPKLARKLARMEKELADERASRKQAEAERIAETEKGKRAEMRNTFQTALTELGLTSPRLLRAALDQLEQDQIMVRDEHGVARFRGTDKYGMDAVMDPKAGLKTWVQSEGKEFLPAVDAGGSGTGAARQANAGAMSRREIDKLDPGRLAAINLERACSGLAPLGQEENK